MGKLEVVAAQKAAVLSAQDSALESGLGACYDQGLSDGGSAPPPGSISQADVDKAVADQKAVDAQAMSDAQAAVADLKSQLDSLSNKELLEAQQLSAVKDSLAKLEAILSPVAAPVADAPPQA